MTHTIDAEALAELATDAVQHLLRGERHRTAGLGTFSTCMRKAAPGRAACKMAMFRADPELRTQPAEGRDALVTSIAHLLAQGATVDFPGLGTLAIVETKGKKRVVFRGASALNDSLTASLS